MFVWKLLFTLIIIYQGFVMSLKDRYLYLVQLLFSIIVLAGATYLVITRVFIYNTLSLPTMIAIVLGSLVIGILLRHATPIVADKSRKRVLVPGHYVNLIPNFALLGINYYLGYIKLTQKDFFEQLTTERQALLITFTAIMSLWIVMNVYVCYKYFRGPSTPLVIPKG